MFKKLNNRVKNLTLLDIKLIKLSVFFTTIIIVKLFPKISGINYPILIVLALVCIAKPFYSFWIKK